MFRIPGLKTIHQSKSYGDDAIYEYRGVKIIGSTARGAYGRHAIYCVDGIPSAPFTAMKDACALVDWVADIQSHPIKILPKAEC
jgi:hypothetical protein